MGLGKRLPGRTEGFWHGPAGCADLGVRRREAKADATSSLCLLQEQLGCFRLLPGRCGAGRCSPCQTLAYLQEGLGVILSPC